MTTPDANQQPASQTPSASDDSFDERVSEHVRRSNEFMQETTRLREEAIAHHAAAERERQALHAGRARLQQVIAELEAATAELRQRADQLHEQTVAARAILEATDVHATLPPESAPQPPPPMTSPDSSHSPAKPPADAPAPRTVLAHGVASADDAIALQRSVRALKGVLSVDAREFSDGVLRLSVVAERGLTADDAQGWGYPLTVVRAQDDVLEVQLERG